MPHPRSRIKYPITQFHKEYPDDQACLDFLASQRKCCGRLGHISGRKSYICLKCKKHIYPMEGTIFQSSRTPLKSWFFAIYLFSQSKHGVSSAELSRLLGVTYKCAYRMGMKIRGLMKPTRTKLKGVVEADETYVGGYRRRDYGGRSKTPVVGFVERGGKVRANVSLRQTHLILGLMKRHVTPGSTLYTDAFGVYQRAPHFGIKHDFVNHWRKEYARGDVCTNTIESFWGQLKRTLRCTHYGVTPQKLQKYVDNQTFLYNYRHGGAFNALVRRI